MKVNLEEIWKAQQVLDEFNELELNNIEFYLNGKKVEPDVCVVRWPGSNTTFIDYCFIEKWKGWFKNTTSNSNI